MIEIVKHRKLSAFLSIVFFLSGITLTVLLSIKPMPVMYFVAMFIVCSLIWGYVAFNYRIVDTILKDGTKTDYVLSIVLSAVFISEHYQKLNELINFIRYPKGYAIFLPESTSQSKAIVLKRYIRLPCVNGMVMKDKTKYTYWIPDRFAAMSGTHFYRR